MMDTDRAWRRWGETDPYYAVLSTPEYRRRNLDEHRAAFFESGHARIGARMRKAEGLYGPSPRRCALDFGCGVGRLIVPLAGMFERVTGVDVSPAMLRECAGNLDEFAVQNAELVESDDTLSKVGGSFDFVHSYIVLQHIPVPRGMRLIRRLLELTAPGGVASIQVTVDRRDLPAQAFLYWMQRRAPGVQMLTNLVRGRSLREPLVEMNEYPLPEILKLFAELGFGEVSVDAEMQGRVESVDLMARRLA